MIRVPANIEITEHNSLVVGHKWLQSYIVQLNKPHVIIKPTSDKKCASQNRAMWSRLRFISTELNGLPKKQHQLTKWNDRIFYELACYKYIQVQVIHKLCIFFHIEIASLFSTDHLLCSSSN